MTDGTLEYTLVSRNGFPWEPQINSIIYCVNKRPERWHKHISTKSFPFSFGGLKALYVSVYVCMYMHTLS